jgi:hypothetical protein
MDCCICLEKSINMIYFACNHKICKVCVLKLIEYNIKCPLCRCMLHIKKIDARQLNMNIEEIIKLANYGIFEPKHQTENVFYKGKNIDVDNLLIPLIKKIWSFEINTVASCQGDDDSDHYGYISFSTKDDLIKILDIKNIKHLISQIDIIHNGNFYVVTYDELKSVDFSSNVNMDLYSIRFSKKNIDLIFKEL